MPEDRPLEARIDPRDVPTGTPDPPAAEAPPVMPAGPVAGPDRIHALDLLRGFALLGILLLNVWAYGMPFPAAMNPHLVGWDSNLDRIMYVIVHMTAYTKTMPIFSMLFGAGILLLATRIETRGRKPAGFVVRRQFWLLVFGLLHAYLLWSGDILVPYAVAGLVVYLFRRRRPRTLLVLALVCFAVPKLIAQGGGYYMEKAETLAAEARLAEAAGDTLTAEQAKALEIIRNNGPAWNPTAGQVAEKAAIMRGPYPDLVAHEAGELLVMHAFLYPVFVGWNLVGYMLLGMVLLRNGVLTGARTPRFYARMAGICYGIGVPLSLLGLWFFDTHPDRFAAMFRWGFPLVDVAGPLVALGHVALVARAARTGLWPGLQARLRAVGRMAFSNYIAHTVICTTIFLGFGFAQWGAWNRTALMGLALAIWALQLWWSPLWLARFRFGPLEWLWRSLSYRKRQPFLVR